VALFAVVHGSMAGPAAYMRLAEELHHRSQRVLPVDRPELTGTDYARLVLLAPEVVLVGVVAAVPVGRAGACLAHHRATTVMRWRL
jgi:hypothetical protein